MLKIKFLILGKKQNDNVLRFLISPKDVPTFLELLFRFLLPNTTHIKFPKIKHTNPKLVKINPSNS